MSYELGPSPSLPVMEGEPQVIEALSDECSFTPLSKTTNGMSQ